MAKAIAPQQTRASSLSTKQATLAMIKHQVGGDLVAHSQERNAVIVEKKEPHERWGHLRLISSRAQETVQM